MAKKTLIDRGNGLMQTWDALRGAVADRFGYGRPIPEDIRRKMAEAALTMAFFADAAEERSPAQDPAQELFDEFGLLPATEE